MPAFVMNILNIVPTIIGIVQSILPLIKEIFVAVVRIIAILPIWFSTPEKPIAQINKYYDKVYGIVEKVKNALVLIK